MRLIIDTNRLMAGLLKNSASREIILSDGIRLYSPDYMEIEIEKYGDFLQKKSGLSRSDFELILQILLERIELIPFSQFHSRFDEAINIMKSIDVKDAPFLAVGLFLSADGIWTEDRHFLKQNALRVYRTTELLELLGI